jgi:hypothetical protein
MNKPIDTSVLGGQADFANAAPLSADLVALIPFEKSRQELSSAELDAIWQSIARQVDTPASDTQATDTPSDAANANLAPPNLVVPNAAEGAAQLVPAAAAIRSAAWSRLAFAFAGALVGASIMHVSHRMREHAVGSPPGTAISPTAALPIDERPASNPPANTAVQDQAARAAASALPQHVMPLAAPTTRRTETPTGAPLLSTSATSTYAPTNAGLVDERLLIEAARTALLRGRPTEALELARKHGVQYPSGSLAEERDFLALTAMRDLGMRTELTSGVSQFETHYPSSGLRNAARKLLNEPPP